MQAALEAATAEPEQQPRAARQPDVESQASPAAGQAQAPPNAQGGRHKRSGSHSSSSSSADNPNAPKGIKGKGLLAFGMITNRQTRLQRALPATTGWAVSLVIVGIIFLILVLVGSYPTTVANQKALNFYYTNIAKYAIYIASGVVAVIGTIVSLRAVRSNRPTGFGKNLLILAVLGALATIGLTGYTISKGPEYNEAWWGYLIAAFIIIQRLIFAVAAGCAVSALNEADKDPEAARIVAHSPLL